MKAWNSYTEVEKYLKDLAGKYKGGLSVIPVSMAKGVVPFNSVAEDKFPVVMLSEITGSQTVSEDYASRGLNYLRQKNVISLFVFVKTKGNWEEENTLWDKSNGIAKDLIAKILQDTQDEEGVWIDGAQTMNVEVSPTIIGTKIDLNVTNELIELDQEHWSE